MSLQKATTSTSLRRSILAPSFTSNASKAFHSSTIAAPEQTRTRQPLTGGKHRRLPYRYTNTIPARAPQTTSEVSFEVISKPGFHGQTEVELNLHGILDRLRTVLGDIPYGRSEQALSRTPLRVLPAVNPQIRGSTITFKVFNGREEIYGKVVEELRGLSGVEKVGIVEAGAQ